MSVWHWAFLALIVSIVSAIFRGMRSGPESPDSMISVSGWLALLIASIGFLAPVAHALALDAVLSSAEALTPQLASVAAWGTYKTTCWSVVWFAWMVGVYAALELGFTRNARAVTAAIVGVWVVGPGLGAGLSLVLPALVFGQVRVTSGDGIRIILAVVLAGAWTAYLLRSARVKMRYTEGLLPDPRRA